MNEEMLELYSDYLISSFSYTTATGLSRMVDGAICHDKVTQFLSSEDLDAATLWKKTKPMIREYEKATGVLVVDDTIEEKPYTDESELVCWHYDHSKGRSVKGINIVTVLYETEEIRVPVSYTVVEKDLWVWDKKKNKEVRKSEKTKNEHMQDMLKHCQKNNIQYKYVITDIWYGSADNMNFIAKELKRHFLIPLKKNRHVACSKKEKEAKQYQAVESLVLEQNKVYKIFLKDVDYPLLLTKLIFKNEDDSEGVLYLVTNDLTLDAQSMSTLYKRRWSVEEYHGSIKGNTSLAASPTKTKRTQKNHVFASIYSYLRLETLRLSTKLNHVALKTKLYVKAIQASFAELQELKLQVANA